ncbi:phospholipase D family protein [Salsipaludibacter albus]|uniref:phospholipase D family protein n=1 Tax=Salsipaludibacter albus TaxID=2849650 RepID=UPI001EE3E9CD|nr:phospholipase D family protein [Salsipaludibacter albus]MBY5162084.1 phospholipase D family protein [Salsipaludibacter albus]
MAFDGSTRAHLGVAYAKTSGVSRLLRLGPPSGSRAVVGLGFGVTDPQAVEQLEHAGFDVRVVPDGSALSASQFHPKLYLVERPGELVTLSGSANLTGAGWTSNVEQYEELVERDPSPGADAQRARFEQVWDHGLPLRDLRRSHDWDHYRQRARDRRMLEREDRRRLVRLQARTGQLVGRLAASSTRGAPGYIAITNDEWWDFQLRQRDGADRALFWRRNTNQFRALAEGGVLFHLVKDATVPEEQRAIRGYSTYPGDYEVADAREAYRRYGHLLGVSTLPQLHDRLNIEPGAAIGIIHLEAMTELERPVTLAELRANGVSFAPNIVAGKTIDLGGVATVFELGGLGVPDSVALAAQPREGYE